MLCMLRLYDLAQTWDLLQIMVYGFRSLVKDFLASHPGHHINPRRVNGSGVETLFGQLKHTTSGKDKYANVYLDWLKVITLYTCKSPQTVATAAELKPLSAKH